MTTKNLKSFGQKLKVTQIVTNSKSIKGGVGDPPPFEDKIGDPPPFED